jgi:hypothetical protein
MCYGQVVWARCCRGTLARAAGRLEKNSIGTGGQGQKQRDLVKGSRGTRPVVGKLGQDKGD